MSVDTDVVGVTAAYLPVVHVCVCVYVVHCIGLCRLCGTHTVPLYTVQYTHNASLDCALQKRGMGKYATITPTTSISTDTIEPLL